MRKASIATIIGVALLLAIAVPVYGDIGSGYLKGYKDGIYCCCPSETNSCGCGYAYFPEICDPAVILGALRDADAYYGEDDDNIYLKASETDLETHVYEADPNGSLFIAYDKSALIAWANAGCPDL